MNTTRRRQLSADVAKNGVRAQRIKITDYPEMAETDEWDEIRDTRHGDDLIERIARDLLHQGTVSTAVFPDRNGRTEHACVLLSDLAGVIRRVLAIGEQQDRENRAKRRNEGIAAAKERGVQFGRRAKPLPKNFSHAVDLWKRGALNTSEAARVCGMSRSTFRYQAKAWDE